MKPFDGSSCPRHWALDVAKLLVMVIVGVLLLMLLLLLLLLLLLQLEEVRLQRS
jgi:hypothetical protein